MGNGHDLVREVLEGDLDAYSALVDSIYPMVFNHYFSILRDFPSHVEDGIQTFLIQLPEILDRKFDYSCKVSTFVFSLSRFYALNYRRGLMTKKRGYGVSEYKDELDTEGNYRTPGDIEQWSNIWSKINTCTSNMSPKLASVFYLYCEGNTHEEIAKYLGIKENVSSKRLFEAKKILRQELKDDFLELFKKL